LNCIVSALQSSSEPRTPNGTIQGTRPTGGVARKRKHWSKYFVKFDNKKWTCRACQENGEPEKYWTSQAWVRRHWMGCAHNPNIGQHIPVVRAKKKKIQKKRKVVPECLIMLRG